MILKLWWRHITWTLPRLRLIILWLPIKLKVIQWSSLPSNDQGPRWYQSPNVSGLLSHLKIIVSEAVHQPHQRQPIKPYFFVQLEVMYNICVHSGKQKFTLFCAQAPAEQSTYSNLKCWKHHSVHLLQPTYYHQIVSLTSFIMQLLAIIWISFLRELKKKTNLIIQ